MTPVPAYGGPVRPKLRAQGTRSRLMSMLAPTSLLPSLSSSHASRDCHCCGDLDRLHRGGICHQVDQWWALAVGRITTAVPPMSRSLRDTVRMSEKDQSGMTPGDHPRGCIGGRGERMSESVARRTRTPLSPKALARDRWAESLSLIDWAGTRRRHHQPLRQRPAPPTESTQRPAHPQPPSDDLVKPTRARRTKRATRRAPWEPAALG